jgi:hypothetical protein
VKLYLSCYFISHPFVFVTRCNTEYSHNSFHFFPLFTNSHNSYGVSAENLALSLTSDPMVNAYAVFIAEPDVAREMAERMPSGRAHLVLETDGMPMLLKDIFSRALLQTRSSL